VGSGALRCELVEGASEARLRGELDLATYESAQTVLAPLFESEGDVVLNLSGLTFADSSGVRLFIKLRQALGDRGVLVLRDPPPHVAKLIELAGLKDLGIRVEPDAS
jgi:anti-anti-sigma factor